MPVIKRRSRRFAPCPAHHLDAVAFGLSVAGDLFPAGSDQGETETLPTAWSQPGNFAKAVTAGREAAQKLASSLKGKDDAARRAAIDEAGKACKGCHESFRKKR